MPDEKAKPCVPFSIAAKLFSSAVLVGFPPLEYSYSCASPGFECAYVEVMKTGGITAPVNFSGC
jgi:hypothetical protein